jgi:hypothetical protein
MMAEVHRPPSLTAAVREAAIRVVRRLPAPGRLYASSGDHRKLSFKADRCTDGSFFYGDLLVKPL